jgi:hypothetical protein
MAVTTADMLQGLLQGQKYGRTYQLMSLVHLAKVWQNLPVDELGALGKSMAELTS